MRAASSTTFGISLLINQNQLTGDSATGGAGGAGGPGSLVAGIILVPFTSGFGGAGGGGSGGLGLGSVFNSGAGAEILPIP